MTKQNNTLCKEAILHIMDSNYAFLIDLDTFVIRIRTKSNNVKQCILYYGDRCYEENEPKLERQIMNIIATDELFDYYEVVFNPKYKRIFYYFEIIDMQDEHYYYYADEFYSTPYANRSLYYQYAYMRENDVAKVPNWTKDAIVYQIFPDSFATKNKFIEGKKNQLI